MWCGLPDVAQRKPSELSGGQQQRVSIARCLVYNPSIILMDEPLGALDKKLREEMQLELKQLHSNLGITALYVTHDQEEALTMSDRIVLLNEGKIEQMGTPDELYFHPRSLFAAEFLGDSEHPRRQGGWNGPDGPRSRRRRVTKSPASHRPPPRWASRSSDGAAGERDHGGRRETSELANQLPARMVDTITFGGVIKTYVRLADDSTIVVQELTKAVRSLPAVDSPVTVAWTAEDTLVLPLPGDAQSS